MVFYGSNDPTNSVKALKEDISYPLSSRASSLSHFRPTMTTMMLELTLLHWHKAQPDAHESANTNEHIDICVLFLCYIDYFWHICVILLSYVTPLQNSDCCRPFSLFFAHSYSFN